MRTTLICLALAVSVCGFHATTAKAYTQTPAPPVAQSSGLAEDLCAVLQKPVATGVNALIKWVSEGRITTSLAGTLASRYGFAPLCHGLMPKLIQVVRGAVQQKPSIKPLVGPFVYNMRVSRAASGINGFDRMTADWTYLDYTAQVKSFVIEYRINGGLWYVIRSGRSVLTKIGNRVQFAVRMTDSRNISSPWIYSLTYIAT